jgi:hypothetical protein
MKSIFLRTEAACAVIFLFVFVSGCCTCPPLPVAAVAPDPMMGGVREWLAARNYAYVTNIVGGVTGCSLYFADHPGDGACANCFINANNEKSTLTLLALLQPQADEGDEDANKAWVADRNDQAAIGFFGFDAGKRQQWFRVSLYRPEGRVTAAEMDHVISEVVNSIHLHGEFTALGAAIKEIEGDSTNDPATPANDSQGIKLIKRVQKSAKMQKLPPDAPVNSIQPVNYLHPIRSAP